MHITTSISSHKVALTALILFAAANSLACGDDNDGANGATPTPAAVSTMPEGEPVSGDITVFAAASLTDAFNEIAEGFTTANPDADVEFNFAGSPALVTQLIEGAPGDVLATADQRNMDAALEEGAVVDAGTAFARNRLVIIVPSDNPGEVETPADLAIPGLRLVLALPEVPVGNYARQALAKFDGADGYPADFSATVLEHLVSEEPNVKSVVTKVQLGEADAGIVYVTDVTDDVAADISTIEITDAYNVIATYPIAVTSSADSPDVAQAFIDYVLSDEGQSVLATYGFIPVDD